MARWGPWICLLCVMGVGWLLGGGVWAAGDEWEQPVIEAVKVEQGPVVDGVLDDACWGAASMVEGFRYREKKRAASQRTQVRFCYDWEACYFAFYCYDSEPGQIRANETKRNGDNFWYDDVVEVSLDPAHVHERFWSFRLNPLGTQSDGFPTTGVEKIEWRGDWTGAAQIVEDGWRAEFAIPFRVLSYPKGQSSIGISFSRYIVREEENVEWPPMPNDVYSEYELGDWVGLETPVIKRKPLVMGYATAEVEEGGSGLHAGLDVKQVYDPGITALASVNPDFENIEDEVESIMFSYGERYVYDRRTFFLEGYRYFPDDHIFYSRRVPSFDAGIKAYGRAEQWEVGLLDAWQVGDRNDLVMCTRYCPDPFNRYEVAFAAADYEGTHGQTGGLEYRHWSCVEQGDIIGECRVARSWVGGAGGEGVYQSYLARLDEAPGHLGGSLRYYSVPSEYKPVDGYVGERGYRGMSGSVSYTERPERGGVQYWNAYASASRNWAEGGGLYSEYLGSGGYLSTKEGASVSLGYSRSRRPPNVDRTWYLGVGWNQNVPLESGRFRLQLGKVVGGDYLYGYLYQRLRPAESWSLGAEAAYQRMALPGQPVDDTFRGILCANYDIDPEHTFAGRYVSRAGRHNFYVSYRQVVRRGLDAYVIVGNPNVEKTEARFAFKIVSVF